MQKRKLQIYSLPLLHFRPSKNWTCQVFPLASLPRVHPTCDKNFAESPSTIPKFSDTAPPKLTTSSLPPTILQGHLPLSINCLSPFTSLPHKIKSFVPSESLFLEPKILLPSTNFPVVFKSFFVQKFAEKFLVLPYIYSAIDEDFVSIRIIFQFWCLISVLLFRFFSSWKGTF